MLRRVLSSSNEEENADLEVALALQCIALALQYIALMEEVLPHGESTWAIKVEGSVRLCLRY